MFVTVHQRVIIHNLFAFRLTSRCSCRFTHYRRALFLANFVPPTFSRNHLTRPSVHHSSLKSLLLPVFIRGSPLLALFPTSRDRTVGFSRTIRVAYHRDFHLLEDLFRFFVCVLCRSHELLSVFRYTTTTFFVSQTTRNTTDYSIVGFSQDPRYVCF